VSPVTGRLDAFQWKDPIAAVEGERTTIEHDRDARAIDMPPRSQPRPAEFRPAEILSAMPADRPGRGLARTTAGAAAPIVPLVHLPDDPGPDGQPHPEPEIETSSEPSNDPWRKWRTLFKP